ncbi:NAP1-related protein [Fagus crenata]
MVAKKGNDSKVLKRTGEKDSDHIDSELVLSIEKLQEIQDELDQFLSQPELRDLMNEEDRKIFKYLDCLDVEDFEELGSGFSITFSFNENPYFEDSKLTKSFTFFMEGTIEITGTTIKWKEGMGASNGVNYNKKGKKRPRTDESFFNWFNETQSTNIEEYCRNEEDEEVFSDSDEDDEEYSDGDLDDEEENSEDDEQDEMKMLLREKNKPQENSEDDEQDEDEDATEGEK